MSGLFLLIIFFLGSCSHLKGLPPQEKVQAYEKRDYIDHLAFLAGVYLRSPGIQEISLTKRSTSYLHKVYNRIIKANELFFEGFVQGKFHIIKDSAPFLFSMPKGHLFLSTGLVNGILETEELLVSAMTYEIIKSNKNVYRKKITIPMGYMQTRDMLDLARISFSSKSEIDKWAFRCLKRAGYDPASYLLWIQGQNKNSLELGLLLLGREISREEQSLKNFLVKEEIEGNNNETMGVVSSPDFYHFKREIKVWAKK